MFDIFLKLQATTGENGGIQNGENIPVHLKHSYWTALLGITMGLLSGVSLAISDVFVMLCIKIGYSPSQVLLVKSLMIVAITIPLLIYKGINILKLKKKDAILNIVKGFSENGACLVYYYAMDGIGMGDTAAITVGTLPIFAPMFACIFIKEKCKLHDCVSVVINVAGIILVSRPQFIFVYPTSSDRMYALIPAYPITTAYLVGMISLFLVYLYSYNRSLQLQSAGKTTILFNINIVADFLADVIVFHKQVVNLEIIGAFLVILSSVIVFVFVCFETKQSVSEETKLVQKPK
ncbi:uncharacterized protein LOC102804854 [Saccoglossus kowalevskii]